jgi:hypothetical protein
MNLSWCRKFHLLLPCQNGVRPEIIDHQSHQIRWPICYFAPLCCSWTVANLLITGNLYYPMQIHLPSTSYTQSLHFSGLNCSLCDSKYLVYFWPCPILWLVQKGLVALTSSSLKKLKLNWTELSPFFNYMQNVLHSFFPLQRTCFD